MGCKLSVEGASQRATNREIESQLKKSHNVEKTIIKILLLGTGEAGKSTIVKQMKIIHNNGFEEEELICGAKAIHGLLFDALLRVLMKEHEDEVLSEELRIIEDAVRIIHDQDLDLENKHFDAFNNVLSIKGIKEKMIPKEKHHFLSYFIEHIDRIMNVGYLPFPDDYLRLRQRTSGIIEYLFKVNCEVTKGYPTVMRFRMIDVGGQRTERRKWIHCFEDVHAILFIVSLAEYDQTLAEDPETNRMIESLNLFKNIFNNKFFMKSGFILFLNKTDIFEEKIKVSPLSICFPEYEYKGSNPIEDSKNFILSQFKKQCSSSPEDTNKGRKNPKTKSVYHHFTCATDTQHIRYIFSSVTEMIIRTSLERTQLI